MKQIELTQGKITTVPNQCHTDLLAMGDWYAVRSRRTFYAQRSVYTNRRHVQIRMHNVIWEMLNGPIPDGYTVDHHDGNGLNNATDNLRLATPQQQSANRRRQTRNTTGFIGVSPQRDRFIARARLNGREVYLGRSSDPFSAAWIRDEWVKEHYGEFASLNNLTDRRQQERRRAG